MTNEEQVLAEASKIVSQAADDYAVKRRAWAQDMFDKMESALWQDDPLAATYDLWAMRLAYHGTTDGVKDFAAKVQANDPTATVLDTAASDEMEANACLGLQHCWTAEPGMPESINGVLSEMTPIMMLHETTPLGKLAGILIRTKAFASQKTDTRPSEADDRIDVIVTTACMGGYMYSQVRRESDGSVLADQSMLIEVQEYDPEAKNANAVGAQAMSLRDNTGELAFLLYGALYMPKVMKDRDPDMYEALSKDVLSSTDDEQGNTQTTGEEQ